MSDMLLYSIIISVVLIIMVSPMVHIYLQYTVFWHRWRKHKYRMILITIVSHYNGEIINKYLIQRKHILGWKDNPEIPGYTSHGELALYNTKPYNTIEECQEWMDCITAVLKNDGRKENPII